MNQHNTVLIVDDTILGRATLETLLCNSGYQLAFASNGFEALELAAELIPDIILLDVMMPDMDGFEVCRKLRATSQLGEVPIILITALDDRDSRLQGIQSGADDFISKPFDRIELRTRVQTIIRFNRYRKLLAARTQFEWVVEQAGDGYLMVSQDGSISYANPQARRYLELPDDTGAADVYAFLAQASRRYRCEPETAWAQWATHVSHTTPMFLVQPESATAEAFWLQVDSIDLPAQAGAERLVRLRNITSEITLQRDMRRFHAMINHKLRTPLASLVPSLEIITRNHAELSHEDIGEIAQIASNSVRRLRHEVEDILQYAQAPTLARNGTGACLGEIDIIIKDIASNLQLPMEIAWNSALNNVQIPLSQRAAELVFWEILENSKKFHPIGAPSIDVSAFQSERDNVHIVICDNGVTLTPKQLAEVWAPYYQAEKEFTGQVGGMGLGLSLVATLVWAVGGTCRINNRQHEPGVEVELIFHSIQH